MTRQMMSKSDSGMPPLINGDSTSSIYYRGLLPYWVLLLASEIT